MDKEGTVHHALINNLPLGRNVDEALRMVDALQFFEENGEVCPANWNKGDEGMVGAPAIDQVMDFHLGEDALDLSGQLGGETDIATLLADYIDLNVDHSGEVPKVTHSISSAGGAGGEPVAPDQVIEINIVGGTLGDSDQAILDSLLNPANHEEPEGVM